MGKNKRSLEDLSRNAITLANQALTKITSAQLRRQINTGTHSPTPGEDQATTNIRAQMIVTKRILGKVIRDKKNLERGRK